MENEVGESVFSRMNQELIQFINNQINPILNRKNLKYFQIS